jgi:hypothetical protein
MPFVPRCTVTDDAPQQPHSKLIHDHKLSVSIPPSPTILLKPDPIQPHIASNASVWIDRACLLKSTVHWIATDLPPLTYDELSTSPHNFQDRHLTPQLLMREQFCRSFCHRHNISSWCRECVTIQLWTNFSFIGYSTTNWVSFWADNLSGSISPLKITRQPRNSRERINKLVSSHPCYKASTSRCSLFVSTHSIPDYASAEL